MEELKFKPFQKVLVRDEEGHFWHGTFFTHMMDGSCLHPYRTVSGSYNQCLPYKGNEHLLGTTNNPIPPEPEFKWGDRVEAKLADGYEWEKAIYCFKENNKFICLYPDSHLITASYCRHADW